MTKKPSEEPKIVGAGVGGAVGGVIGAVVGGPIGAAIGAGVAGWLGHQVESDLRKKRWSSMCIVGERRDAQRGFSLLIVLRDVEKSYQNLNSHFTAPDAERQPSLGGVCPRTCARVR